MPLSLNGSKGAGLETKASEALKLYYFRRMHPVSYPRYGAVQIVLPPPKAERQEAFDFRGPKELRFLSLAHPGVLAVLDDDTGVCNLLWRTHQNLWCFACYVLVAFSWLFCGSCLDCQAHNPGFTFLWSWRVFDHLHFGTFYTYPLLRRPLFLKSQTHMISSTKRNCLGKCALSCPSCCYKVHPLCGLAHSAPPLWVPLHWRLTLA